MKLTLVPAIDSNNCKHFRRSCASEQTGRTDSNLIIG